MVTIDELRVTVRVEGSADADELAFARLFDKYIALWHGELLAQKRQSVRSSQDRALGDRNPDGGEAF